MTFKFEGMTIERLAAHTIFAMRPDKQHTPPDCSDELIPLGPEALDLIQQRITEALGHTSHGVEVGLRDIEVGSFFQLSAQMMKSDDPGFLTVSKVLAEKLTRAQTHPKWPGGVLMVISGTVGKDSTRFLAALKAEADKGINLVEKGGKISLELVKKMLLSATQRLYKIGILLEIAPKKAGADGLAEAENYRMFLFDHLLTATETRPAAAYFYSGFLGVNILASARHHTRIFFEETNALIRLMDVDEDKKADLREALRTELRSNKPTLNAAEFAKEHLPEDARQGFVKKLIEKGFPDQSVVKDVAYISSRLRRPRQLHFSSGVIVRVPADGNVKELVEVSNLEDGYTAVKIKGVIDRQD